MGEHMKRTSLKHAPLHPTHLSEWDRGPLASVDVEGPPACVVASIAPLRLQESGPRGPAAAATLRRGRGRPVTSFGVRFDSG